MVEKVLDCCHFDDSKRTISCSSNFGVTGRVQAFVAFLSLCLGSFFFFCLLPASTTTTSTTTTSTTTTTAHFVFAICHAFCYSFSDSKLEADRCSASLACVEMITDASRVETDLNLTLFSLVDGASTAFSTLGWVSTCANRTGCLEVAPCKAIWTIGWKQVCVCKNPVYPASYKL